MHMKLWQLYSIVGDRNLLLTVVDLKTEWDYLKKMYKQYFEELDPLKTRHDRSIPDTELPEDFVKTVLKESGLVCYRFHDGSIRSYTYDGFDGDIIPATDVYLKYGGDVLERVFDRSVAGDTSDDLAIRKIMGTDKIQPDNDLIK